MGGKRTEACGRCGLSTVVDAAEGDEARDIYGDERIEVTEEEIKAVSGHVELLGRAKSRLNAFAERITYGTTRSE